jgi:hypothetical protein
MGASRWSPSDWSSYSSTTSAKPAAAIFRSKSLDGDLDPKDVLVRESRDSDVNPESNAIIVGVDVTGSMGMIAEYFIKTGLGILFEEILTRKPVTDPHLMVMAIGDVHSDDSPLQVSQFEADIKITEWLEKVHVEHGGGANNSESYHLPLYFAANHTSIDCFEKRGKKGYLFTIGDEFTPPALTKEQITRVTGDTPQTSLTYEELYEAASKTYEVYHIIIAEGSCARSRLDGVTSDWTAIIGQHAIVLSDYKKLSELIVSIIEINEGADKAVVAGSWSGDTSLVVRDATKGLSAKSTSTDVGVVKF